MSQVRRVVEDLFGRAGVALDGSNAWDVLVRDERLFGRIVRHGSLGLGEAYMDGWWDCQAIDQFVDRVLRAGLKDGAATTLGTKIRVLGSMTFNPPDPEGFQGGGPGGITIWETRCSPRFWTITTSTVAVTSRLGATWPRPSAARWTWWPASWIWVWATRVLDIGCGWGGLARYMAERHGCKVLAVNISREQIAFCPGVLPGVGRGGGLPGLSGRDRDL